MPTIVFLCGIGTGVTGTLAVVALLLREPVRPLPAATLRAIARDRRASRLAVSVPLTSIEDFDNQETR